MGDGDSASWGAAQHGLAVVADGQKNRRAVRPNPKPALSASFGRRHVFRLGNKKANIIQMAQAPIEAGAGAGAASSACISAAASSTRVPWMLDAAAGSRACGQDAAKTGLAETSAAARRSRLGACADGAPAGTQAECAPPTAAIRPSPYPPGSRWRRRPPRGRPPRARWRRCRPQLSRRRRRPPTPAAVWVAEWGTSGGVGCGGALGGDALARRWLGCLLPTLPSSRPTNLHRGASQGSLLGAGGQGAADARQHVGQEDRGQAAGTLVRARQRASGSNVRVAMAGCVTDMPPEGPPGARRGRSASYAPLHVFGSHGLFRR